MDNNEEFLKALAAFRPVVPKAIEYRVYYDPATGQIQSYTNDDLPGDFIVVDRDTFAKHRFDCVIKNGQLVPYRPPVAKLTPAADGTACHASDVAIIAGPGNPITNWKMKTYED